MEPKSDLILASASPRRKLLLKRMGYAFTVKPSRVKEPAPREGETPRHYVLRLAQLKARDVQRRETKAWVLGADTVVVHRGQILGKPKSRQEAQRWLSDMAGRWHRVYTGVAVVNPQGHLFSSVAMTRVKMKFLDESERRRRSRHHHDKAGAYAAQARGNPYIDRVEGEFSNVVGLPATLTRVLLRKAGMK